MDENVKKFWEEQAREATDDIVTHRDHHQVRLEIEAVLSLLQPQDEVLDVGCGTGFADAFYARKCRRVLGMDIAPGMIDIARKKFANDKLGFEQGDVMTWEERRGTFSVVISTRCLINLGSWEEQQQALFQIHRCLLPGGLLILTEGSSQGRQALSALRVSVGLPPLPRVWHNLDFDEEACETFLSGLFQKESDQRFGLFDVLTRVQYPLSIFPVEPQYRTPAHEAAVKITKAMARDPFPQYSREFVWALRKKERTLNGGTGS